MLNEERGLVGVGITRGHKPAVWGALYPIDQDGAHEPKAGTEVGPRRNQGQGVDPGGVDWGKDH